MDGEKSNGNMRECGRQGGRKEGKHGYSRGDNQPVNTEELAVIQRYIDDTNLIDSMVINIAALPVIDIK